MSFNSPSTLVKFEITDQFDRDFDILQNVDVIPRTSDTWFIENNKLMVKMRKWTTQVGNTLTGWSTDLQPYKQIFYTDSLWVKRYYRSYNKKVYYLNGNTWTDLWPTWSSDNIYFNIVTLPTGNTLPLGTGEFTMDADATWPERVNIDPLDTLPNDNIGKPIMIMSGLFKGAYGYIWAFEGWEYAIDWAGVIAKQKTGTKYKIWDTVRTCLQITEKTVASWSVDRYFDGITELTNFAWFATSSLRQIKAIESTENAWQFVTFNNAAYTYKNNTVFFTWSTPGNPLFFNLVNRINTGISGTIIDAFIYNNRMILLWSNFIGAVDTNNRISILSTTYGGTPWSFANLGEDGYYFNTNKQIVSLNENSAGNLITKNVGKIVYNYINNYDQNICAWFDGKKYYLYGEKSWATTGTIVVFDLENKFWSTHTGLNPASFLADNGTMYMVDNRTGITRKYDETVNTDLNISIEQLVASKEIDLWNPFMLHNIQTVFLWMENFDQVFDLDTYFALNKTNSQFWTQRFNISQISSPNPTLPLGEDLLGEQVLWGSGGNDKIAVPILKKKLYNANDAANKFKLYIKWVDGSPFYMSEMRAYFTQDARRQEPDWYFDITSTV